MCVQFSRRCVKCSLGLFLGTEATHMSHTPIEQNAHAPSRPPNLGAVELCG